MCGKAGREIQACPDGARCTVSGDHSYDRCTIKLLERKGRGIEPRRCFRVDVIVSAALEMMSSAVTM
jgi:hypothetical protein